MKRILVIRPGGMLMYGDAADRHSSDLRSPPSTTIQPASSANPGGSESFVNGFRLSITDLHGLIITNRRWNSNRYFGLVEWRNVKALDTAACPIESPFTHSTVREPEFKQFTHWA